MIAVDTNIVVRLLTRDEPAQFERARALFAERTVFLPETVLLEAEWVLRYAYGFERSAVVDAMRKLLGLSNVRVADAQTLSRTLQWHADGLDFADALHLASSRHADAFFTFDRQFVQRSKAWSPCPVREP